MSDHAKIGPSNAERWINCPGSVALSEKCPPQAGNEYAVQGTVAHDLAEKLVSGKITVEQLMKMEGDIVTCEGFDIEVDSEMIDGVIEYNDIIKRDIDDLERRGKRAQIHSLAETKVTFDEDVWGTSDFLLFQKGFKLIVYDFKYGKYAVEATENKQLGIYALAAMRTIAGEAYDEIELVIVQPRGRHAEGSERRWTAPRKWLSQFAAEVEKAVFETKQPDAKVVAGGHCKYCPAKAGCPVMFGAAEEATQAAFSTVPSLVKEEAVLRLPDVRLMPLEKLALALEWEAAIDTWFGGIKDRVRDAMENGIEIPGWKLVEGRSNRRFTNEDEVIMRFAPIMGEEKLHKPRKLLSPAALEKVVGKGKLDDLTYKPEAKRAIARSTDPRFSAPTSALEAFDPLSPKMAHIAAADPLADPLAPLPPDPFAGVEYVPTGEMTVTFVAPPADPLADPLAAPPQSSSTALEDELLGDPLAAAAPQADAPRGPIWPV